MHESEGLEPSSEVVGRASEVADNHYDLAVIGSGSGNSMLDERFAGLRVALIDNGTFGGTCLNHGCIPTKMFVVPADLAVSPQESSRLGVDLDLVRTDFPAIRDRIFARVDAISQGGLSWRERSANTTVFQGTARFVDPHTLEIETNDGKTNDGGAARGQASPQAHATRTRITADRIVLANGSRPVIPDIPGLDAPGVRNHVHTSDTVMRLPELPERMVIIGGGFIAAEFAHVFDALGSHVTLVHRSATLLRHEDAEVSARFTEQFSAHLDVRLQHAVIGIDGPAEATGPVVVRTRDADGTEHEHPADVVLVATGRVPNSDTLNLDAAGVRVGERGFIEVDEHQRTSVDHIWALGDVCSPWMLKHVANAEMRTVQHNLLHPDDLVASPHEAVPHAVFSHPQVAAVGCTEQELQQSGRRYVSKVQAYGDVAYGWALEDQGHFVKLLGDPESGQLLGAHLIGPMASVLVQPLVQAMAQHVPYRGLARSQYWIHPALTEVVENALLGLEEADA